jgi:hypothetical protein
MRQLDALCLLGKANAEKCRANLMPNVLFLLHIHSYAKQLSDEDLSQLAAVSPQLSCRDIKEVG